MGMQRGEFVTSLKDMLRPMKPIVRGFKDLKHQVFLKTLILKKTNYSTVDSKKVNIGSGNWFKCGWKTLDYVTEENKVCRKLIDYNHDLMSLEKLPFSDESVEIFYVEHVLEHLPSIQCNHLFREFFRCLKKNGVVRIIVPDIDKMWIAFKSNNIEFFHKSKRRRGMNIEECLFDFFATYCVKMTPEIKITFLKNSHGKDKEGFLNFYTKQIEAQLTPEIQHKFGGHHVNWFDFRKMNKMLVKVGFDGVYKSSCQKSMLQEMQGRNFDTRPKISLFVEAIKEV